MRVSKPPERRRAELIDAARLLFDKNGVNNTRISDIVQYVGVAQGVFYYYFASKAEIVDVIAKQATEEIEQRVLSIFTDEKTNFYQKLANYISLYIDVIDQFLGDEEENISSSNGDFYQENIFAKKGQDVLSENWGVLIAKGVSTGEISIEYPEQTACVVLSGLLALSAIRLPTRPAIYTIVEQSFHLPHHSLTQFSPTTKKGERE